MRNLTIKRNKSFVACFSKMKIYIEDSASNELVINNVPCRKLGDLKNGEEKTFQIGEESVKVFVIADKLSKNICNEFYQIPEGQDDVSLSGQNRYNLMNGNAFLFDGVTNEDSLKNRKQGKRRGLIVLCIAVIVGSIVGFISGSGVLSNKKESPKVFSNEGMTITLTDAFEAAEYDGYTVCYESANVAVFALKEEFSLAEGFGDFTIEEYAELVFESNGAVYELKESDDLTYFEYDANIPDSGLFRYYAYLYKSHDAFWMVNFAVHDENADEYADRFVDWAKSVEFTD